VQACQLVALLVELALEACAQILTDHVEAVERANGRTVAIDAILMEYEAALEADK
jgi:hypothetical protein